MRYRVEVIGIVVVVTDGSRLARIMKSKCRREEGRYTRGHDRVAVYIRATGEDQESITAVIVIADRLISRVRPECSHDPGTTPVAMISFVRAFRKPLICRGRLIYSEQTVLPDADASLARAVDAFPHTSAVAACVSSVRDAIHVFFELHGCQLVPRATS